MCTAAASILAMTWLVLPQPFQTQLQLSINIQVIHPAVLLLMSNTAPPCAQQPAPRFLPSAWLGNTLLTLPSYVVRSLEAERTPVWLMRQAGRYMAEFRAYSDKYPFRMRSETPEIAIELSLQPWRAFKPDGEARGPFPAVLALCAADAR